MASWLVLGCGYTGAALVRRVCADDPTADVTITRRTAGAAAETAAKLGAGIRALALDLAAPAASQALPRAEYLICLAPPGDDPAAEVRAWAASTSARKLVYLSSTGVYPAAHGASVDETFPIAPATASGHKRVLAEAALARHARAPWVSLRAAGIYGPGRGLVDRIRAGTYRIVGDGRAHVSRIHVDDLVTAIVRAATTGAIGAINVADDDPAPVGDVADAIAAALHVAPPPRVPVASVDAEVAGMLTADRRIANRRMHDELGVVLRYPSWRAQLATATAHE